VKSGGDFEDILAEDTPAIWKSHRPAKGGATGKMFEEIIQKAAAKKAGKDTGKEKRKAKNEKGTRPTAKPRTKSAERR